jgi:class 3 adenylate cyclase
MPSSNQRHCELLLVLLGLCAERPVPSENVTAELTRRLGCDYRPSRDRVEPALEALEAEGLIEREARDDGVAFRTTVAGIKALDERAETRIHTFLFTDAVGSTALLDRLGDRAAHELRRRHFALLRTAISDHAGTEVKSLGDGLMVAFRDAPSAVACAMAMQLAAAACGDPVRLRIGIDVGEAVREGDDFFGRPVIVARRLCDAAQPCQVVVSEAVCRLAGPLAADASGSLGELALKGFSHPVRASALRRGPATPPARDALSHNRRHPPHGIRAVEGLLGVAAS